MNKLSISGKVLGIVALLFVAVSCQKEDSQVMAPLAAMKSNVVPMKAMAQEPIAYCGTPTVVMLTAGQHIDAGTVTVGNDANFLYVTYTSANGYLINETHLYVGPKSGVPVNKKGNPQIGQFPYGETFTTPVNEVTYQFNLADFDDCFIVAAHAVVSKYDGTTIVDQQTAWGAGNQFIVSGSWAMYFDYCKQECTNDPEPVYVQETAFAYGYNYATCFLDWGFSRWGWSNAINEGNYSFEIWAAAGQCDLSKGTLVGNLLVNYANGVATVTYSMNQGFVMLENHLYVGANRLPLKNGVETVAPGQYPIVVGNLSTTSTTYTINNLSGPIYVVAHAVVEWEVEGNYSM
ncbi:hypothetical protein [Tenuifilum osseticum]|uniref:hypothetical protein n=1 Tax=Tenuifilum osseticum TaxID=3374723 RepID=UPI0034E593E0